MRGRLVFVLASLLSAAPARAGDARRPYADDRDHFTLLDQHLLNRDLKLQLDSPEQQFRLGNRWNDFAAAGDLAIGGQVTPGDSAQTRFHGYYLADTYLAVRALEGLEANLNVLWFNPSASDGYRVSSQVSAGLGLHAYYTFDRVLGDHLRVDLLGTDLGWVTTGAGLLLEQTPLDGVRASGSWREFSLDWMYGGRALWPDDDFITTTLSFLGKTLELRLLQWQQSHATTATPLTELRLERRVTTAWFVGASSDLSFAERFHLAAEYAAHVDDRYKSALLARADVLSRDLFWLAVHAGYQFRWYEDGFGPRDTLSAPSLPFSVPRREDQYATNSFEYLGISSDYEQWSHTLMGELRLRPFWPFELFVESEFWLRYAAARNGPRVIYTPDGFRAPGRELQVFYRSGLSVYPWRDYPHRLNAFLTNKQIQSGVAVSEPVIRRYDPGTYAVFEVEAFL